MRLASAPLVPSSKELKAWFQLPCPLPLVGCDAVTLHTPARSVTAFSEELNRIVDLLKLSMQSYGGVGLAAPQVGIDLALAIVARAEGEKVLATSLVLVNPTITHRRGCWTPREACLSLPGQGGVVPRDWQVVVEAVDGNGEPFRLRARGLQAHILQHEIDHLEGRLYTAVPGCTVVPFVPAKVASAISLLSAPAPPDFLRGNRFEDERLPQGRGNASG